MYTVYGRKPLLDLLQNKEVNFYQIAVADNLRNAGKDKETRREKGRRTNRTQRKRRRVERKRWGSECGNAEVLFVEHTDTLGEILKLAKQRNIPVNFLPEHKVHIIRYYSVPGVYCLCFFHMRCVFTSSLYLSSGIFFRCFGNSQNGRQDQGVCADIVPPKGHLCTIEEFVESRVFTHALLLPPSFLLFLLVVWHSASSSLAACLKAFLLYCFFRFAERHARSLHAAWVWGRQ